MSRYPPDRLRVGGPLEDQLFASFEHLATFPGLGHRRSDLTSRSVVFFTADPYLIIYDRHVTPITIYAVLHSVRDLRRILRKRP